jgi:hypothetical protein
VDKNTFLIAKSIALYPKQVEFNVNRPLLRARTGELHGFLSISLKESKRREGRSVGLKSPTSAIPMLPSLKGTACWQPSHDYLDLVLTLKPCEYAPDLTALLPCPKICFPFLSHYSAISFENM